MNDTRRDTLKRRARSMTLSVPLLCALGLVGNADPAPAIDTDPFASTRTIVRGKCLPCHDAKRKAGGLDLARFRTLADVRADPKPWTGVLEQIEAGQMPPAGAPQATPRQRRALVDWTRSFLDAEARARKDDPGVVPVRRLSNAEYDATIRDLTGVDLRPTREFPPDGAGGEGFTNASEALGEISPTLLGKYLDAAREVAAHAVFTPAGVRFSPSKTRRDWSDEGVARLQQFYRKHTVGDGRFDPKPLLRASLIARDRGGKGKESLVAIAAAEKVHVRHLARLLAVLEPAPGSPDAALGEPWIRLRRQWRKATLADIEPLFQEVEALRGILWTEQRVGNYLRTVGDNYAESTSRQLAVDPPASASTIVRADLKPAPGSADIVVRLTATEARDSDRGAPVRWRGLRLEAAGKPALPLRDYPSFGPRYEVEPSTLFKGTADYLDRIAEGRSDGNRSVALDPELLARWNELAGVRRGDDAVEPALLGKPVRAAVLAPLSERVVDDGGRKGISGWRKAGTDLPVVLSNATDEERRIPGLARPHRVLAHPTPGEFVGIVWTSPVDGLVALDARVAHVHPDCGNGIAWFTEHRRAERATALFEDRVALGGTSGAPTVRMRVRVGDRVLVGVDAKDGNHGCDLTEVECTIRQLDGAKRWDLATDVATSILAGNPHGGEAGDPALWAFVAGPARPVAAGSLSLVPPGSVLARWQEAVVREGAGESASRAARQVESLLAGPRPGADGPDRQLYDQWVGVDSPLFSGIDTVRIAAGRRAPGPFALPAARFDQNGNIDAISGETLTIRLPASLAGGRSLVVEGAIEGGPGERVVNFGATVGSGPVDDRWNRPVVGNPSGTGFGRLKAAWGAFREIFPKFLCFPAVIPTDEVVSLKMFHREDDILVRLLEADERGVLERLWAEHRHVSRQAVAEEAYLPQFIGFVSQDQPKAMLDYFNAQRPVFKARRVAWESAARAAQPAQRAAVLSFAAKAWRRPLAAAETEGLDRLVAGLRKRGVEHEEAWRSAIARILASPAFLLRAEPAPPGTAPRLLGGWEIATRLGYFLWSSVPDDTLRAKAARGDLSRPDVLRAEVRRMAKDPKVRAFAEEFGAQWLKVRGFDKLDEKNERLFPTFDAALRADIYEETLRFIEHLVRADRPVREWFDADYTFLNASLAGHYGIPGVEGNRWRRVDGVRRHGRGGLLTLATVLAKESAASRTSPVLRGNWVSETLLGETLPKPPPTVPKLPEDEGVGSGLSVRALVERHAKDPACWTCHQRIDPIGFAFERYDAIGRRRDRDAAGNAIDTRTKLRDGARFDGVDGLRAWLLGPRKDTVLRVFARRLLGYAVGRSTTLSDTALVERIVAVLRAPGGTIVDAMEVIVASPQFRMVRGGRDERFVGRMTAHGEGMGR